MFFGRATQALALIVAMKILSAYAGVASEPERACRAVKHHSNDYVVCRFDPATDEIRLFLSTGDGAPFEHFNWVNEDLADKRERLVFAMNAGMYHESRAPVGLYVERGEEITPLNENDGPGNFHLKPNGVFFINSVGKAFVLDAPRFAARFSHPFTGEVANDDSREPERVNKQSILYATQSGPMLVIDGAIHPKFLPDSDSLKRRNGVGVTAEGEVIFVLADTPVRFYDFAMFFRDELKTPNALYLDGSISRLYSPELSRNDPGVAMGPIVGVVVERD